MKRILFPTILVFAVAILAFSFTGKVGGEPQTVSPTTVVTASSEDCSEVHWSYKDGAEGPNHWKGLCKGFADCGGKVQSPIDINTDKTTVSAAQSSLEIDFGSTKTHIKNNGHTIEFGASGDNITTIGDKEYELAQFHYHAKSEHTVNGKHFPLEVHFVHRYSDTDYAVLGVMFEEGKEYPLFTEHLEDFPTQKGKFNSDSMIDLRKLLPADTSYYHYNGSLTTPPCSEVVNWYVLKEPVQASKAQLDKLEEMLHGNFRPVMPMQGRKVFSFSE